jgi:3-mercaptopyruvate sulfurtransferase SseA
MFHLSKVCGIAGLLTVLAVPIGFVALAQTAATPKPSSQITPAGRILIGEAELKGLIGNPRVKLVDLRARKDYDQGHIAGAISLPWGRISVSEIDGVRNEVAADDVLSKEFGRAGLSYDDTIVLYDKGATAGRGYIVFDYAGFKKLHVLDGGASNWTGGFSTEATSPKPVEFVLNRKHENKVDKAYVAGKIASPAATIVDARAAQAFEDGHIPTAKSVPMSLYLTKAGKLQPREEVLAMLARNGLSRDREIVLYCGSGYNASNVYLFMKDLGFEKIVLYDASWDEWSRDPSAGQELSLANFSFGSFAGGAGSLGPRFLSQDAFKQARTQPGVVVLDVRSPADYLVGRIADSVNVYWNDTLDEKRVLKPRDQLEALYKAVGATPDKRIILFTRGGFQAAHSYTVLKLLGYPNVDVFNGKWEGWFNPAFAL